MKRFLVILALFLSGLTLSGQTIWIDSLYAIPTSPSTEDIIVLIGEIRTSSAGCERISTEMVIDENNHAIEITCCYAVGPMDTICSSIDTFYIGPLQAGWYHIKFTTLGFETILNPNGDCSNSMNEQVDTIDMMVEKTNSTEVIIEPFFDVQLTENPVRDYATFKLNSDVTLKRIVLLDYLGSIGINQKIDSHPSHEFKLDVSHLPPGMYFGYLEWETGISRPFKIMKE